MHSKEQCESILHDKQSEDCQSAHAWQPAIAQFAVGDNEDADLPAPIHTLMLLCYFVFMSASPEEYNRLE